MLYQIHDDNMLFLYLHMFQLNTIINHFYDYKIYYFFFYKMHYYIVFGYVHFFAIFELQIESNREFGIQHFKPA